MRSKGACERSKGPCERRWGGEQEEEEESLFRANGVIQWQGHIPTPVQSEVSRGEGGNGLAE